MELTDQTVGSFFMAVRHTQKEYILNWFKENTIKYNVKEYCISWEIALGKHKQTDGEHFHILLYAQENIKKITTNIQKHFKLKYNLIGQAKNGDGRQYGVVKKEIRSPNTLLSYIVKDNNYYCSNGLKDNLTSLPKWEERPESEKQDWFFTLQTELEERNYKLITINEHFNDKKQKFHHTITTPKTSRTDICELILEIYIEKNLKPPTKAQMDSFIKYHQLHYLKIPKPEFIAIWYYHDNY